MQIKLKNFVRKAMEYLKKVIKYYKATFNGEIIEKCKRKILIKTGVLKKINFINTNETEVKINPKMCIRDR